MAGNGNSGRIPTFHLLEKELKDKIDQYKADSEAGVFGRCGVRFATGKLEGFAAIQPVATDSPLYCRI